jgi:hypothetical protein
MSQSHEATLIPADDSLIVRKRFAACCYAAVQSFLDVGLADILFRHVHTRAAAGLLNTAAMGKMPGAVEASADPLMENVLSGLVPRVEELSGKQLHPTYSFVRIYRRGDRLERHRDRPSCEVSVSVNLGSDSECPWPLWIAGPCGEKAAHLGPGDALLYRGNDCEHWREPFEGSDWTQLFLHYVEKQGQHADLAYDRRKELFTRPETD